MDEIKIISKDEFDAIVSDKNFDRNLLYKDYIITLVLYLIKDVKNIYFKGGTALQKIFLNYSRLSEDIDFTVTKDINIIKQTIVKILENTDFFEKISIDKNVDGFIRILVHYKDFEDKENVIFIDLNERANLITKPEEYEIKHFYNGFIPKFQVNTLSKEEMMAEKVAAAIGRNKPRDHFDVYKIIKKNYTINIKLVKKKCKQSKNEFDIIKMFNNANKLKNRWDNDLVPLLAEDITFKEVITTLAKHFKLKEAKKDKNSDKPHK